MTTLAGCCHLDSNGMFAGLVGVVAMLEGLS